ncbi:hypothetical protein SPI_06572 [Niveomyces insectorum RCEF 264]|uniref:Carboxymuconolactone decarboxylase n=1 Tax=Niveomyces insectorum RCEF 264 TaxID=1081102 RepID=A0A167RDU7_9HYPO|nr:hypothetical protein SPI_06572 [Niveomyces insectorum RCEF 264]
MGAQADASKANTADAATTATATATTNGGAAADTAVTAPPPAFVELFQKVEATLVPTSLGADRWYIVVIACFAAGPDPEAAVHLYRYLCGQPRYQTPASRQALVRRLREALVKVVSIVGVCKPLEAILAISAAERPEDKDHSPATREGWQCDEANLERAMVWYDKIYKHNAANTLGLFEAHQDFIWLSKHITYGLYLADRQVLDDLDTEMVVFPAIMSQNLKTETWWHIRGTRRVGVSKADTQVLWDTIKVINAHFGVTLDRVPTVDEVEHDV